MKPIEPSSDGTPPLPLQNQQATIPPRPIFPAPYARTPFQPEPATPSVQDATPVADVFESDPFFNSPDSQELPEPDTTRLESSEQEIPVEDELISDDIPFETNPLPLPDAGTFPSPTAEERLLSTIVHEPAAKEEAPVSLITEEQLARLQTELADATEEARNAGTARVKAQQDFHSLKTRFAALETELTAAKLDLTQTRQLNSQIENRFAEAEKQWTDKLSHLRSMLDEVEDTRDEVFQKRVPKLLFIGTLVAGIVATIFAYIIGAGQATAPVAETPSKPQLIDEKRLVETPHSIPIQEDLNGGTKPPVVELPHPAAVPVMGEGRIDETPHPENLTGRTKPSSPSSSGGVSQAEPAVSHQIAKKPIQHISAKSVDWPDLSSSRWSTTSSAKEQKVVFHYGIFTHGVELSSTARQDLKAIAANLKGKPFQIEAEGHTDASKVTKAKAYGKDNQSIGLARAKAVAHYLTDSCGLPASQLSASSAGERNPPYPNTTEANQQKNRTVVLKITAK